MKGMIFNLFEDFVSTQWNEESYELVLSACPLKTKDPFVGPDTYPDQDLFTLVSGVAEHFQTPVSEVLRAFGKSAFPKLAAKYPMFLKDHSSAKTFLMSVHDVIHVEVRKLHPAAVTPSFHYTDNAEDELIIHYSSGRRLCFLMEGFLEGVADKFDTSMEQRQQQCMHDGADTCDFHLKFVAPPSTMVP